MQKHLLKYILKHLFAFKNKKFTSSQGSVLKLVYSSPNEMSDDFKLISQV